jgi:hypothetical protein
MGLHTAIHTSELLNLTMTAEQQGTLVDGFFTVNREYITKRTTMLESEQRKIENELYKIGVLTYGKDEDTVYMNADTLVTLMLGTDEKLLEKAKKISKKSWKPTKEEGIKINLKNNIKTTNAELRMAYEEWIDAVYDRQGWLNKKCVEMAEEMVDSFSHRNLDVALKLLEIASANGYRDISWAIKKYNEKPAVTYNMAPVAKRCVTTNSQLSNEVF